MQVITKAIHVLGYETETVDTRRIDDGFDGYIRHLIYQMDRIKNIREYIASEQPLNNILTPDIMGILTIFFIASTIYMFVCNYEVNQQITMTKNAYDDLKENYKDVLTADEIKQIFSSENGVVQRVNQAKKKKRWYLFFWGLILIILFSVLLALSGGMNFTKIVPFENLQQATSETAIIKNSGVESQFSQGAVILIPKEI